MRELAKRSSSSNTCKPNNNTLVLRVIAVMPKEYAVESRPIKEKLSQFAQELKIKLQAISARTTSSPLLSTISDSSEEGHVSQIHIPQFREA
jgi:hypothetical protein